jgi:hypothetical protein
MIPKLINVIRSTVETDDDTGLPLYWSNSQGWVSLDEATSFTEEEMEWVNLPSMSEWKTVFSKI